MTVSVRPADSATFPGRTTFTVTPAGLVSASIAGREVLSGEWETFAADDIFSAPANPVGQLKAASLNGVTKHACRVTQEYERVTVRHFWSFTEEDAQLTLAITNNGMKPIRYPGITGPVATFPATPRDGVTTDIYWNQPYLTYCGRSILTPSYFLRLRCSYLAGGGVGVGICPTDLIDERNLIWWEPVGDAWSTYTSRGFKLIWDRSIPPLQTKTFEVTVRVSDTEDWRHLLQPYKSALPPVTYGGQPDTRPVVMWGTDWDLKLATKDNPHGFLDSDGRDLLRRPDKAECIPAWQEFIPRAKAAGVQGMMVWQPGGYAPEIWPHDPYQIDSHCIPADVLPQFLEICQLAAEAGLWVGSLLRPAELQYRHDAESDGSFPFRELSADVQEILEHRIGTQEFYGAGKAHYLDSFGLFGGPDVQHIPWLRTTSAPDAQTAAWLRSLVGVDVPLYAEACSDLLSRYCGAYAEWSGTGWTTYGPQIKVLQWLRPTLPVLALHRGNPPYAERRAWGEAEGMAPLVLVHEIPAGVSAN